MLHSTFTDQIIAFHFDVSAVITSPLAMYLLVVKFEFKLGHGVDTLSQ